MLKANQRKGRLLLVASSLVIVFALGLGTLLAQPNGGASPTDVPLPATLEAIMAAKTAYAKAYPSPTATSTPTPDITQTLVQETRNARPTDSIEVTASYIVGQATNQAAIQYTETTSAIFGIPTGFSSPQPANTIMATATDTLAEVERQKAEYVRELTAMVGFTHPIFDELAQQFVDQNQFNGRGHIQLDKQTTSFRNNRYIALTIHREGNSLFIEQSYLVLFRISDDGISLLDNKLGIYMTIGLDQDGFTDRNKNGLPDLAIYTWYGGKCCLPDLHVFEIKANHQIEDISPWTTDVYPARFIDIDNDGIPEIQAESATVGISTIYLTRWFGWNGQAYVDISRQHPELYLTTINVLAQQFATGYSCNIAWQPLENYLVNFYAMGRLSDGWEELQRLLKIHCSAEELQKAEGVLKDVEQWMNSLPKS